VKNRFVAPLFIVAKWVARPESAKGVVRDSHARHVQHALRGLRACHPGRTISAIVLSLAACIATRAVAEDRLVLLDGETVTASISGIAADGALSGEGVPQGLDLDGLWRIERSAAAPQKPADAAVIVELAGGGRVLASGVTMADERCHVTWQVAERLSFPIDVLRAIRFEPKVDLEAFDRALATPSPNADRLFVKADDRVEVVPGLLELLDAEKVVFQFEGQQQTLPRGKLYGIVLAQLAGEQTGAAKCRVELQDGSSLRGTTVTLQSDRLTLQLSAATKVELPWAAVSRVDVRSSRMVFLSDLDPVEAVQQPLVTFGRPWQRDRSVGGRSLSLGDRKFEKGLGVHSLCRLSYDAKGTYDQLAAVIGIDAETGGKGDCVFTVLGDGRQLFTARIKGNDPPQELRLDIRGVKQLTLLVEPGEDLDLADHANWCDVRLIRQGKSP
jgi:hypothetical protein